MESFTEDSGLHVLRFGDWAEFREYWNGTRAADCIFRGQRDPTWPLASVWDRQVSWMAQHLRPGERVEDKFVNGAYDANPDQFLKHFQQRVGGLSGLDASVLKSTNDWWAFARHHGLISPLLDWTREPLVGAFFALIDYAKWIIDAELMSAEPASKQERRPHVAIWRLDCSEPFWKQGEFEKIDGQPVFESRQEAQAGLFTRVMDGRHFEVQSYLSDRGLLNALCRCDFPTRDAGAALRDLHDSDVHYASLFPDISGAVMYANSRRFVKPENLAELMANG